MRYTLFISDLHLDEGRPQHLDALAILLTEHAGTCDALYVLGDLFETWIGDDDDNPFHLKAIAAFRRFSDSGSALYFMHGNRDFLLGTTFADQCGGTLIDDGTVVDLYGRPVLLMHGDSLCTADEKYMAFRKQARDPAWQADMLGKPLAERRMIAQMIRMKSAHENANKASNIMDVTPEEVIREMEAANVMDLIHGHTHRPAVHDVPLANGTGKRWVLGDWGDDGWQIIANDTQDLTLERFPLA